MSSPFRTYVATTEWFPVADGWSGHLFVTALRCDFCGTCVSGNTAEALRKAQREHRENCQP
jgi:hypothetical protein